MSWKSKSSVRTTNLGIEDVRVPAAVNYHQAIYKCHVRNLKCHDFLPGDSLGILNSKGPKDRTVA